MSMTSIATILTGPSIIHRSACGMGRRAKVEQPFLSSGNRGTDLNLEERCPCGLGQFRVYFPLGESEAFTGGKGHHHFCKRLPSHTGQEQACSRISRFRSFVCLFVTMPTMAQYTGKWFHTRQDQERGMNGPASLLHS